MTQTIRTLLLICNVAAVMLGGVAWLIPASKEPGVWWFRIGALLVLISATGFFLWTTRRRDPAPDFLSKLSTTFFERDGFAFTVTTEVVGGVCHLCVWFQNRYERACEAEVLLRTSERWLAPQMHLPEAKASIMVQPGAFGKALSPWPLPVELQGRKVVVDVMAKQKYPRGQGKLLRYRTGLAVGTAPLSGVLDTLAALGALTLHNSRRAARAEIQLPQHVGSTPMLHSQETTQTVWKLGDPVDVPGKLSAGSSWALQPKSARDSRMAPVTYSEVNARARDAFSPAMRKLSLDLLLNHLHQLIAHTRPVLRILRLQRLHHLP